MPTTSLYRTSGWVLLVGAVLGIIGDVLASVLFPNNDPGQSLFATFALVTLVSLIGQLLLLMGLPSIVAREHRTRGWLGLAGLALTFLGGCLFTSRAVIALLITPWLAKVDPAALAGNGPPLFVFFSIAGILFGIGGILLGVAVMRGEVFPRSAGLLLIVGALLNAASSPIAAAPLRHGVSLVATVAFIVGLGWMGCVLMSEGVSVSPSAELLSR